jgi:hypothetical protein
MKITLLGDTVQDITLAARLVHALAATDPIGEFVDSIKCDHVRKDCVITYTLDHDHGIEFERRVLAAFSEFFPSGYSSCAFHLPRLKGRELTGNRSRQTCVPPD